MPTRSVIVTGGLGGIGRATALAFAAEGASIALVDAVESDGSLEAALRDAGAPQVECIRADISDEAQVAGVVERVMRRFGRLDVIVNVAGIMIYKPIVELTAADWRRSLDVNLLGAALLTGHGLRLMQHGGCIVNVASIHARRTSVVSLTRSAAIEGKPLGIRVNAILPGAIDTPLLHASPTIKSGIETIDPADLGVPADVAALACFLASDAARFINGEDIVADGGRMGRL
jgi:NAD(P)-dependent dehydrogenase (short-subunit alcohol dehydrogenase family)